MNLFYPDLQKMSEDLNKASLSYHEKKPYGKLSVVPTKPLVEKRDLALAYSPGVAAPCLEIEKDPLAAAKYTMRSNLIAVITNGTAVLGLGNIGPLAAKPVMEGKAALFKKFSDIDAFDIEVNEKNPDKFIEIVAALEPTFGGINLEDIRAPECFYIEEELKKRLKIPVFHDDQHGTAIIVAAAILNALTLVNKKIEDVTLVASGAGAASIACLDLLCDMGLVKENIIVCDSKGVLRTQRSEKIDPYRKKYMRETPHSSLADAMKGADIFLGLSVANVVSKEMVASMAEQPIVLALANPDPEILPQDVKAVRDDAIIATGRSDFPNQVNNALCFPYIFRGALDVGATVINQEMKIAAVKAIAELARAEASEVVTHAYEGEVYTFGRNFIIPKPFDPRLHIEIASVVAKTAMETNVATLPIYDMQAYREQLNEFVNQSTLIMKPVFTIAKKAHNYRVAFAEGEEERVLQAVQILCDENVCHPLLIGRPDVIQSRIQKLGLRLKINTHYHVVNPNDDPRYHTYWTAYLDIMSRRGISPAVAKTHVRTNTTVIAALMSHLGDADAIVCGTIGRYIEHFRAVRYILGARERTCATLCCTIQNDSTLFFSDPYVNECPSDDQLFEIVRMVHEKIKRFGVDPKIALVSHSNFGTSHLESARKMRQAIMRLHKEAPYIEVDGEMHTDLALDPKLREKILPNSLLKGRANCLIFPNIESANIAYNFAKSSKNTSTVGPILMGMKGIAHILDASTNVRSIVNAATLCVVEVEEKKNAQTI